MNNLLILGDICPTGDTESFFDEGSTEKLFGELLTTIKTSKKVVANLEYPIVNKSMSKTLKCGPSLRGSVNSLSTIKRSGISMLSLANNHIGDYGSEGVEYTIDKCNELGFETFGAGKDAKLASKGKIIQLDELRIGIISFAEHEFNAVGSSKAGANIFDPYVSYEQIEKLSVSCDFLVVLYHGGIEYYRYPSPLLAKKCRKFIDSGASLVLCQHSHCVGTEEKYKGKQIVYGQGNAIYGFRPKSEMWNEGLAVNLKVQDKQVSVDYIPFEWTSDGVKVQDHTSDIIKSFRHRSELIKTPGFIEDKWQQYCKLNKAHYFPMFYGLSVNINRLNRLIYNGIIDLFYTKKQKLISLNLIRCDSHKEVMQTILEKEHGGKI